jgi:hypothetical protein
MSKTYKLPEYTLSSIDLSVNDKSFFLDYEIKLGKFGFIDLTSIPIVKPDFIVVGYQYDFPFCCHAQGKGVLTLEENNHTRFVNTDARSFFLSVYRFGRYCDEVKDESGETNQLRIVNNTINDLKNIDGKAWSDNNNFWPIIGHQMIEGNL